MEVFKLRLNSNEFQTFLPSDDAVWNTGVLKMDCLPKLADWQGLEIYVQNPMAKRGSFFGLCSGSFVIDGVATEGLRSILEWAGELLPLEHDGVPYHLLNILECVNCLDVESTEWVIGKRTGAKIRAAKYRFHKKRFSESTLFKIPETALGEILCVSGIKDPEDEFKFKVESSGFKGLLFERLWSDDED